MSELSQTYSPQVKLLHEEEHQAAFEVELSEVKVDEIAKVAPKTLQGKVIEGS